MAVVVEAESLMNPMTLCGSAGHCAPHPPLRQAAGRYRQFTLLRCVFIDNSAKKSIDSSKSDGLNVKDGIIIFFLTYCAPHVIMPYILTCLEWGDD